jgi:hypothetical protein
MDVIALAFLRESNRIEGILHDPTAAECREYERFMTLSAPTVADLGRFVSACQPGARLRDRLGLDVRVGDHVPPPGGPAVVEALEAILGDAVAGTGAFEVHQRYEQLHPFTDGNGRSGRMLWWWQVGPQEIGFLHRWYYQSLSHWRGLICP